MTSSRPVWGMTAIIVDTSAVLASPDEAYAEHEAIAGVVTAADGPLVVSPLVAAESDYMLCTRLGAAAARQFAAAAAVGSRPFFAAALRLVMMRRGSRPVGGGRDAGTAAPAR